MRFLGFFYVVKHTLSLRLLGGYWLVLPLAMKLESSPKIFIITVNLWIFVFNVVIALLHQRFDCQRQRTCYWFIVHHCSGLLYYKERNKVTKMVCSQMLISTTERYYETLDISEYLLTCCRIVVVTTQQQHNICFSSELECRI